MSEIFSTLWQPGNHRLKRRRIEQHGPHRLGRRGHRRAAFAAELTAALGGSRRVGATPGRRRRFGAADDVGQFGGNQRQLDVLHAERVGDRVGDADRRRHAVALPDPLRSERRERRRRLHVKDDGIRDFGRGRQQVVGERAGQEAAVRGVGVFFIKSRAQSLREPAADLSIDHSGMKDGAAIVHRHIAVDTRHQTSCDRFRRRRNRK